VWNDSGRPSREEEFKQFSATGGGCSTLFTAPSWQQNVPGWANTACGTKRLDNDVAAVADPYTGFDIYDSYDCGKSCEEGGIGEGWVTIGGTSLSSPLISSIYALAGGSGGVGYPAATLYGHLGQTSLYDVTECEFEYGTSTSYGSKAPCKSLPGSGSSPVAVSASIAAGLAANTEYHFRISATNAAGTAKGEDLTFKTS
jgi:subtilase family serine protease